MITQLLQHNRIAYVKVMNAFRTSNRTCVVHPTGTGKSYLIAAVSESFRRVLILGPNTFVLDQVHGVLGWRDRMTEKGTVEYMTYTMLMYRTEPDTGYDLICLDEFHRAGAPEWGEAVDRLLSANPQAKVLGTTATPIRYLDDERDMADELFGGNVASHISIGEAWSRAILPVPTYVTGLFEFTNTAKAAAERIGKSRNLSAAEKRQRLTRVNNLRLDWEMSQGMPQIIRKHIDADARRIIVFCGSIDRLNDMQDTITGWFRSAGFRIAGCVSVHSFMTDRQLKDAMEEFGRDSDDGIRLMLSVNMLNEGVHIPRVNAVLLLRTTSSKNIYMQQIGRCLTAANTERPVILDMVDNITTVNIVHGIREDYDWYAHQRLREPGEYDRESKSFVVFDYAQSLRSVIERLVPKENVRMTMEERLKKVRAFCEEHDRLPKRGDGDVYRMLCNLYIRFHDHPDVTAIRERWGRKTPYEDFRVRAERLIGFCKREGRMPLKEDGEEFANRISVYSHCKRYGWTPELEDLRREFARCETDESLKRRILSFVKENGRLPSSGKDATRDEINLRAKLTERKHLHDDPEIRRVLDTYMPVKRNLEEKIALMQAFTAEHGRCPYNNDEEKSYYHAWANMLSQGGGDARVAEMRDKYMSMSRKKRPDELAEYMAPVRAFIAANRRMPMSSATHREECSLYRRIITLQRQYADVPEVAELLKEIEGLHKPRNCRMEEDDADVARRIKEFVTEHDRLPSYSEDADDGEKWLRNQWCFRKQRLCATDPEIRAICDQYSRSLNRFGECFSEVSTWAAEHGKLPGKKDGEVYRRWSYVRDAHRQDAEVIALMRRYGYREAAPRTDIDARLDMIESFAEENGRLPSTAFSEEVKIAQWWHHIKRMYGNLQRVTDLKERYPKQNRK